MLRGLGVLVVAVLALFVMPAQQASAQSGRIVGGYSSPQEEYAARRLSVARATLVAALPDGGKVTYTGEDVWVFATVGGTSHLTSRDVAEYIRDDEWEAVVAGHEARRRRWLGYGIPATALVFGVATYGWVTMLPSGDTLSDEEVVDAATTGLIVGTAATVAGMYLGHLVFKHSRIARAYATYPLLTLDRAAGIQRAERYNRQLANELGVPYEAAPEAPPAPETPTVREEPTVQWQLTPFEHGARGLGLAFRF